MKKMTKRGGILLALVVACLALLFAVLGFVMQKNASVWADDDAETDSETHTYTVAQYQAADKDSETEAYWYSVCDDEECSEQIEIDESDLYKYSLNLGSSDDDEDAFNEAYAAATAVAEDLEGYAISGNADDDGYYSIAVYSDFAAVMDGVYGYEALNKASSAAKNAETEGPHTIVMYANFEYTASGQLSITDGEEVVLDLNGNWVKMYSRCFNIGSGAKLTVIDSTATEENPAGNGGMSASDGEALYVNGGTLIVNAGTYVGHNAVYSNNANDDVTINGGLFKAEGLEVGKAVGAYSYVVAASGSMTINGGTFIDDDGNYILLVAYSGSNVVINGGCFTLGERDADDLSSEIYCLEAYFGSITINGGTFNAANNLILYVGFGSSVVINDGTLETTDSMAIVVTGDSLNNGTSYGESGLTINGGSITSAGGAYTIELWGDASVEITGGEISGDNAVIGVPDFDDTYLTTFSGNSVTISGGTLTNTNTDPDSCCSVIYVADANAETDDEDAESTTLTITGGTLVSAATESGDTDWAAVYVESADVEITGGTIETAAGSGVYVSDGSLDISGGTVTSSGYAVYADEGCDATITGGSFTSTGEDTTAVYVETDVEEGSTAGSLTITAGSFSSDVSDYAAEGVEFTTDDDGNYVSGAVCINNNGVIGGYFSDLAGAVAGATDGDTIVLLQDVTVDSAITVDKLIVLDLNGYSITFVASGDADDAEDADDTDDADDTSDLTYIFIVAANGELEIVNSGETGSVISNPTEDKSAAIYVNGGALTVTGSVEITGYYAINITTGSITLTGEDFSGVESQVLAWAEKQEAAEDGTDTTSIAVIADEDASAAYSEAYPTVSGTELGIISYNTEGTVEITINGAVVLGGHRGVELLDTTDGEGTEFTMTDGALLADGTHNDKEKTPQYLGLYVDLHGGSVSICGGLIEAYDTTEEYDGGYGGIAVYGNDADNYTGVNISGDVTIYCATWYALLTNGTIGSGYVDITIADDAVLYAYDGSGIYFPAYQGSLTITGGTITGHTALEIRAGTVNISGGDFIATGAALSSDANSSGGTTKGAAIAIVPHTTEDALTTVITGGTFTGADALYEANNQDDSAEALAKMTLSVEGGEFSGNVQVENFTSFISGGTYTGISEENEDFESYIASGAMLASGEDGSYTVKGAIQVGDDPDNLYTSFEEALDAAEDGDTITILANITVTNPITISQSITLDLNGFTIIGNISSGNIGTSSSNGAAVIDIVAEGCTVIIKDSSDDGTGNGTGMIENTSKTAVAISAGTLIIESGTFYADDNTGNGLYIVDGTVTINGGTFIGYRGVYINAGTITINGGTFTGQKTSGSTSGTYGIYTAGSQVSYITITGGTFTGNTAACLADAFITITGGTFEGVSDGLYIGIYHSDLSDVFADEEDIISVSGGSYSGSNALSNHASYTPTITDGTFEGSVSKVGSGTFSISGGTWTTDIAKYVEEGSAMGSSTDDEGNITYSVNSADTYNVVINTYGCDTLEEAISHISTGTSSASYTITLNADAELDSQWTIAANKTVILNLNGYTISFADDEEEDTYGIVINGSLDIESDTAVTITTSKGFRVNDEASLTIGENVTIEAKDSEYGVVSTGTLEILGSVINETAAGEGADYDNVYGVFVAGGTVTVEEGAYISGTSYGLYINSQVSAVTATISGGTISGDCAIAVQSHTSADFKTTFTMTDGTVTGTTYGIATYGAGVGEVDITINGGTITATDGWGMYLPDANQTVVINDGTITGAKTGIEVREGTLTISGGHITSEILTEDGFAHEANDNGPTVEGAGLAISTYDNSDVTVTISGGVFTGYYAVYEAFENGESAEDEENDVNLTISDGTFNGLIYSASCEAFISGGTFSTEVDGKYFTDAISTTPLPEQDESMITITYDGTEYTFGTEFDDQVFTVITATGSDAGTYTVYVIADKGVYFTDEDGEILANVHAYTYTIEKAANSITDFTVSEDGIPSATAVYGDIVYRFYSDADCTTEVYAISGVGTYYVMAYVAESANYAAAESGPVSFTVEEEVVPGPTELEAPVQGTASVVYDGEAHEFGAELEGTGYTVYTAAGTNAGEYTVYVVADDDCIFTTGDTVLTYTYTITKAANSVTTPVIAEDGTITTAAVADFGTVVYQIYSDADCTTVAVPSADGTYYVRAEVAGTDNYAGAVSTAVSFTIETTVIVQGGGTDDNSGSGNGNGTEDNSNGTQGQTNGGATDEELADAQAEARLSNIMGLISICLLLVGAVVVLVIVIQSGKKQKK